MILAAYRNPPYRSPTPRTNNNGATNSTTASSSSSGTNSNTHNDNVTKKASSLSPPPQHTVERRSQSPKRKRQALERQLSLPSALPSSTPPTMLSVVTGSSSTVPGGFGGSAQDVVESGADSPRTKVAERFKGLEVQDAGVGNGNLVERASPRKKLKVTDVDGDDASTPPKPLPSATHSRELEIPDSEGPSLLEMTQRTTMNAMDVGVGREVEMGSPSPSPIPVAPNPRRTFTKVPSLRKESSYLSTREPPPSSQDPSQAQQQPTSSPPQKRRFSSPTLESMALDPTPLAISNDTTSLTWSWSEITGHDIDTSNPDDDGEGVNGIGFKPTPAMAAARKLKRKKQVEEWKTREAREARQRRAEGRRRREGVGGSGSSGGEGVEGKRVVRFVDW